MDSCFETTVKDKVAYVTLNRPDKRNSLIPSFWSEFPSEIQRLSSSGAARVIVISGQGKHFCSGIDLSVFMDSDRLRTETPFDREELRGLVLVLQEALTAIERARVPVIAAIQGACVGAGLDLVSACDFRYATTDAFFCIQEIHLGIMADLGTLQRMPRKMPEGIVKELAYTGDKLSSERAKSLGFVNEVFPDTATMIEAATAAARRIAEKPPLAISFSKESINYSLEHSVNDSLLYAANLQAFILDKVNISKALQSNGAKVETEDLKPLATAL